MKRNKDVGLPSRSVTGMPYQDHWNRPGLGEARSGYTSGNQKTPGQPTLQHVSSTQSVGSLGYLNKLPATSTQSDDLVLEDSVEDGETLLGDGKSGLFAKASVAEIIPAAYAHGAISQSRSSRKSKGLSGPGTSSLDKAEKRQLQRHNHSKRSAGWMKPSDEDITVEAMQQLQQQQDSPVGSASSRTKVSSVRTVSDLICPSMRLQQESLEASLALITQHREKQQIDNILSMGKKDKKQRDKCLPTRTSRHSNVAPKKETIDLLDNSEDSIHKSSISQDKSPGQSGSSSNSNSRPSSRSQSSADVSHSHSTSRTSSSGKSAKSSSKSSLMVSDFEDMDDLEELCPLNLGQSFAIQPVGMQVDSKPIDLTTAVKLKTLVLGDAKHGFSEEWKYQSFTFSDAKRLQYGFVQKKGGPCGVLASVQAFLLKQLLFADGKTPSVRWFQPLASQRTEALAAALATILWRAGQEHVAVVALPSFRPQFVGGAQYKSDNLTETLFINTFTNYENMLTFIKQNIMQFEFDGTSGVILALYSVILSRSVEGVRSDMDETSSKLIGAHDFCTQDMVNLFLTGRAAPNVFNDVMELDSGQGHVTLLQGIHARNDIGFLSLFEHYKSCEVGTYFKTPRYPIWVVCSESHFTVLFGLKRELLSNWKAERRFDLYYYDGLGQQEDEIRLSIDTTNKFYQPPSDTDLVPPLELCIRTKWADAEVDWNGTEPIL